MGRMRKLPPLIVLRHRKGRTWLARTDYRADRYVKGKDQFFTGLCRRSWAAIELGPATPGDATTIAAA